MASFLGGNKVKISIDLLDKDAQTLSYRILNHVGAELLPKTEAVSVADVETYEIEVPAELNKVDPSNQREIRLIEVYIETSVGVIKTEEVYSIESEAVLVVGENSFQSYPEALMTATTLFNIESWDTADKETRVTAMMTAWRSFGRLRFRYNFDSQDHIIDESVNVSDITKLSISEFNALPQDFRDALKRAQILEVDNMLDTDSEFAQIRKMAEIGVTRSEVYEAKVSLGSGTTPYKSSLCSRAMGELTKWLMVRRRLARTA